MRKLVFQEKVDFLIGLDSSGVAKTVVPSIPQMKTPLIITHAATPDVTGSVCNRYVFRVSVNLSQNIKASALLTAETDVKTWTTIGPDYAFGHQSWEYFEKYLKAIKPGADFLSRETGKRSAPIHGSARPTWEGLSMIKLDDIHVYYGDSYILQGVSLNVQAGEIVCLLGRNGAGKTTTMRGIMGYNPPARGSVHFDGRDITGQAVYANVRQGIGFVPEDRRIFPDLTVMENLAVATLPAHPGQTAWSEARIFEIFPLLVKLKDHKGGALSGGEQQMLSLARALMGNPRLLLLDEPCEGLAPIIVENIGEIISALKTDVAILLTEQNAHFALGIADRGYVIDKGRVCYEGMADELAANEEIQQRYLAV